jgi:hypothetical protein
MSTSFTPTTEYAEVDFEVVKEPWTRYKLDDGTLLRIRTAVAKIFESKKIGDLGYPNMGVAYGFVLSTMVPEGLRGPESKEPLKLPDDIDKEVSSKLLVESEQEYLTADKYILTLKPVLTKVVRTKKFNALEERIYQTNIQNIVNIKKAP